MASLGISFACALASLMSVALIMLESQALTYTTYNDYDPAAHDYKLDNLYCATWDSDKPLEWRKQYKWTAFSESLGMGPSVCGRCLSVTNQANGASITVRIVDQCENGGLDLETDAFNAIDDGRGSAAGHMFTSYDFWDCA